MLSCFILGDSIALGVSQHMPECHRIYARVGAPSTEIARKPVETPLGSVVIVSAGANDCLSARLLDSLDTILGRIHNKGAKALFIVPSNCARVNAWTNARKVSIVRYEPGKDGVHPTNYRNLAETIRRNLDHE